MPLENYVQGTVAGLQTVVKYKLCSPGTYMGSAGKMRRDTIGGVVLIIEANSVNDSSSSN